MTSNGCQCDMGYSCNQCVMYPCMDVCHLLLPVLSQVQTSRKVRPRHGVTNCKAALAASYACRHLALSSACRPL